MKKGTNRMVFLIGKFVIKVPIFNSMRMFLFGCFSNYNERYLYKKWMSESDIPTLNRVCGTLFCSWFGLLSIQRRCFYLSWILEDYEKEEYEYITSDYEEDDNYGKYQGRIVLLDYGTNFN